jgi:hypothetical protein
MESVIPANLLPAYMSKILGANIRCLQDEQRDILIWVKIDNEAILEMATRLRFASYDSESENRTRSTVLRSERLRRYAKYNLYIPNIIYVFQI